MLDVPPIVEPDEDVIMEDAPPLVSLISAPDPVSDIPISSVTGAKTNHDAANPSPGIQCSRDA